MMSKSLKKKLGVGSTPRQTPRKTARFPAPPPHFADEERQLWRKLVRDFAFTDAASLAVLRSGLEAHHRMRRCRENIDRIGELTKEGKRVRAHPLLSHERDARAAWLAAMRALGVLEPQEK